MLHCYRNEYFWLQYRKPLNHRKQDYSFPAYAERPCQPKGTDNRMLLYSNDIECGNKQEVLIKMWTLKEELLNYNFNYEIYVDSYEI